MLLRRVVNALMLIPPRSIVVRAFSFASTRFPARRCDHELPRQRSSCFGGGSVEPRNDARPLLARCSSSSSSDVLVEEFNDLPLVVGENDDDDDEQHAPLRPDPDLPPDEIPTRLMMALSPERVHVPHRNAGLETMWEFAGGNTRYVFDHDRTDFVESALETAAEFPTSFYGAALRGRGWTMEGGLNRVGGHNNNDDCWIATQVMRTVSEDGRVRRWQWELRKNRRPPNMGCWLVDSIGSSDRKGNFEADD